MDSGYVTAHPYAKAIFAIAVADETLQQWSRLLSSLALIAKDSYVIDFLIDPRVNWQQRADLFIDICGKKLTDEEHNFVSLLAQNHRLQIMPYIAKIYEKLHTTEAGIVKARVISATKLSANQKEKLQQALQKRLQRVGAVREPSVLEYEIDKSILGGLIIWVGDQVIDGSIRNKLNRLEQYLLA